MLGGHQPQSVSERALRVRQEGRHPGEGPFLLGVEDVEDRADQQAVAGLFPVRSTLQRPVFHPLKTSQLIEECFDQLLASAEAIADPFEQAFFVMAQLPYLQPFDEVNKRGSRLAANILLVRANLAPLSFTDAPDDLYTQAMPAVYERRGIDLL